MAAQNMAMVPYEATTSLVTPLASPEQAKAAIQQYEALKAAIIQPKDVYREERRDRDGNMRVVEYLKKSFWRRLATCFGLSLELARETRETDEKGALAYSAFYRAIAPNGRTVEADGYCSRSEPGHQNWSEHSIRATAHTRAKNRAISDMVGGGEVSYEEMHGDGEEEAQRATQQQTQTPRAEPTAHKWTQPEKAALFKRWQALQADGFRDAERFAANLRGFLGHDAPFTDAERDRFAAHVTVQEARKRPHTATVVESTLPATPDGFPETDVPADLSELDVDRIGKGA